MNSWKQFFITTLAAICLLMPAATHADELETLINLQAAGRTDSRDISRNEADNLIGSAMGLLGVAYRYGGTSANTGFDCSGFMQHIFRRSMQINLPRTSAEQARMGEPVSRSDLQPGDMVFFRTAGPSRISHVGMYIGGDRFIHAPRTGKNIEITSITSKYWSKTYAGARRVSGAGKAASFVR